MQEKTCRKCLKTFPATLEFFYKNAGGKYGVTPRCKLCVDADNRAAHAKRLAADPARVRAQAAARSAKHYHGNLTVSRARARDSAARARQDPKKKQVIAARKRADGAGLTPAEIEAIRIKQNDQCAICGTLHPTDLDHCHASDKVRWLLCRHCNRGLGAFRDQPALLRKAAALLEELA